MSINTVSSQDLIRLLTIFYQGSLQKNPLSVPNAHDLPTNFFKFEDIEQLANELGLSIPSSDLLSVLQQGLKIGLFQKSYQKGTECNLGSCQTRTTLPIIIYAYNPNMLRVNPNNRQYFPTNLLSQTTTTASFTAASYQPRLYSESKGFAITEQSVIPRTKVKNSRFSCCRNG